MSFSDSQIPSPEVDPNFSASPSYSITAQNIIDLNNLSGINTGDQDLSAYILSAANLTSGRIPFASGNKTITDDSALTWDNTNKIIGLNGGELKQMSGSTIILGKLNAPNQSDVNNSVIVGYANCSNNTTGDQIVFGKDNLKTGTTQTGNIVFGSANFYSGAVANTIAFGSGCHGGSYNVVIGRNALSSMTSGNGYNVVIGNANAARYYGSGSSAVTSLTHSVMIGDNVRPGGNSETNEIVIGDSAIGHGSNTATIGNSSNIDVYLSGYAIPTSGYKSTDGSQGLTQTINILDGDGTTTHTFTFKNGLLTGYSAA